jgi:hypothetical protein
MDYSNRTLKIKIKKEEILVTELANTLSDINQIDVLLKAFEDKLDAAEINKYSRFSLYFYRDTKFMNKYGTARIAGIKKGSIEIILTSIATLSSIIVPIIIYQVQKNLDKENIQVSFEIDSDDQETRRILEEYKEGTFGKTDDSFEWLLELLEKRGYSIHLQSENVFILKRFTNIVTKRIVRTFRKY